MSLCVAIVGSRTWRNQRAVEDVVAKLPPDTAVVTGGARGVDTIAENAAFARGLKVNIIRPDWEGHGKKAGMLRNTEIVAAANVVLAFWDGRSSGTLDSIRKALKIGRPLRIYLPSGVIIDHLTGKQALEDLQHAACALDSVRL